MGEVGLAGFEMESYGSSFLREVLFLPGLFFLLKLVRFGLVGLSLVGLGFLL